MLSFKQELTAAGLNQRLLSKTHDNSAAGTQTFNNTEEADDLDTGVIRAKGGVSITKSLRVGLTAFLGSLNLSKNLQTEIFEDSTATGENAEIASTDKTSILLTDEDLVSVASITGAYSKIIFLINATGNTVVFKHGTAPEAVNKIISSTGKDVAVKANSLLLLMKVEELTGWVIVAGGGGGGGSNYESIIEKDETSTINIDEKFVLVDATTAAVDLELPLWSEGAEHEFYRLDAVEGHAVNIITSGTDQILSSEGLGTSYSLPYRTNRVKLVGIKTGIWGVL